MMFNPETESPTTETRPDAAFAAFADIIAVLASAKHFAATQAALRARLAAAIEATAAVQARAEQMKAAAAVYSTTAADDALRLRLAAAIEKYKTFMPRRERLYALEIAWRTFGEDPSVTDGIRAPMYDSLTKARAAQTPAPDVDLPDPVREDRHGQSFPDGVALTRQPAPVLLNVRRATPRQRGARDV
jgi:hypothetical protein